MPPALESRYGKADMNRMATPYSELLSPEKRAQILGGAAKGAEAGDGGDVFELLDAHCALNL